MVFLFVADNLTQCIGRTRVDQFERGDLFVHMAKHYTFDCHGRGSYRIASKQPRHRTKDEAAKSAKVIAPATTQSPSRQLSAKRRSMASLVRAKVVKFVDQVGRSPAGEPSLGREYADRAMLSSVIHLHHAVAQRFSRFEARGDCHFSYWIIGKSRPCSRAQSMAISYPASAWRITPVAGSFQRTRSRRRAASSVPSATITTPECCE